MILKKFLVTLLVAFIPFTVLAQSGADSTNPNKFMRGQKKCHGGQGIERIINTLDLDQETAKKLRETFNSSEGEIKNLITKVNESRKELRAVSDKAEFNEDEVRAASRKLAAAQEELHVLKAKRYAEAKSYLTSEQQAQLDNLKRRGKFEARRSGRDGKGQKFQGL